VGVDAQQRLEAGGAGGSDAEGASPAGSLEPALPWERGTNANTNGLLWQYFPKGTDLSVQAPPTWTGSPTELNDRPRKRLGFRKPIEEIGELLLR